MKHYQTTTGDYIGVFKDGEQPRNAVIFEGEPPPPVMTETQRLEEKLVEKGVLVASDLDEETRAILTARKNAGGGDAEKPR